VDERGKRKDQKQLEAHIFICTRFNDLYSSWWFFDAAHSGGDSGPKENTQNIPRAINGSFREMDFFHIPSVSIRLPEMI
jgi:hypothetical protein